MRLTWSLTPHSPAEGFTGETTAPEGPTRSRAPACSFSVVRRQSAHRRAGLTPKSHHAQQPRVALRGSFRLRLASTCNHRPARGPWASVRTLASTGVGEGAANVVRAMAVREMAVRAMTAATTDPAPALRRALAACSSVEPVVVTSSINNTLVGTTPPDLKRRPTKVGGADRRSAAVRPVCAGPEPRASNDRHGRRSRRATARAKQLAVVETALSTTSRRGRHPGDDVDEVAVDASRHGRRRPPHGRPGVAVLDARHQLSACSLVGEQGDTFVETVRRRELGRRHQRIEAGPTRCLPGRSTATTPFGQEHASRYTRRRDTRDGIRRRDQAAGWSRWRASSPLSWTPLSNSTT